MRRRARSRAWSPPRFEESSSSRSPCKPKRRRLFSRRSSFAPALDCARAGSKRRRPLILAVRPDPPKGDGQEPIRKVRATRARLGSPHSDRARRPSLDRAPQMANGGAVRTRSRLGEGCATFWRFGAAGEFLRPMTIRVESDNSLPFPQTSVIILFSRRNPTGHRFMVKSLPRRRSIGRAIDREHSVNPPLRAEREKENKGS